MTLRKWKILLKEFIFGMDVSSQSATKTTCLQPTTLIKRKLKTQPFLREFNQIFHGDQFLKLFSMTAFRVAI